MFAFCGPMDTKIRKKTNEKYTVTIIYIYIYRINTRLIIILRKDNNKYIVWGKKKTYIAVSIFCGAAENKKNHPFSAVFSRGIKVFAFSRISLERKFYYTYSRLARIIIVPRALIKTEAAAAVVLGLLENRFKLEKEKHTKHVLRCKSRKDQSWKIPNRGFFFLFAYWIMPLTSQADDDFFFFLESRVLCYFSIRVYI